MYESDCSLLSVNGNTEQLIIEQMMSSIHTSLIQHMEKLQSKTRHSQFGPEHIATIFCVSLGTAKNILIVMTQKGIRHAVMPLTRRYRVDHIHLHHTYLASKWMLDHIESKYKSVRGHTGAIIILNGNFVMIYPTAYKGDQDSTELLLRITEEVGIPANLKCDTALAFIGQHTDFLQLAQKLGINTTYAEPYQHN